MEKDNETFEVDENDEEFISDEMPEESFCKEHFKKLQLRLGNEDAPKEYLNGSFWIQPMSQSFVFLKNLKSTSLYQPRVFIWLPHHFLPEKMNSLKCPECNSQMKSNGYNKNPYARRVVDLSE